MEEITQVDTPHISPNIEMGAGGGTRVVDELIENDLGGFNRHVRVSTCRISSVTCLVEKKNRERITVRRM